MLHLGDITKISGYTAPVVDCIIGGSPCQDLSVAGKRAGLDGERSGLYIEQVRIVKEMRERDEHNGRSGVNIRPRYMVWENVPGAFSSNKGEDFRIVLEELAKVKDPNAVVPMPEKWTNNGCIVGDGWSIAWRVLDAQFWGVPQRRRRIALVADFGGESAPEILFVSQSVSRDTEPSKSKREATPSDATRGFGADDKGEPPYTLKIRSGVSIDSYGKAAGKGALIQKNLSATLGVSQDQYLFQPITFEPGIASREGGHIYEGVSGTLRAHAGDNQMATAYSVENHPNDSRVGINEDGKVQALTSRMGTGGGNVPMVLMEAFQYHGYRESDTCGTITAGQNSGIRGDTPLICYTVDQGGGKSSVDVREGKAPTLTTTHDGSPAVCYSSNLYGDDKVGTLMARDFKGVGRVDTFDRVVCQAVDCRNGTEDSVNGALQSNSAHSLNGNNVVRTRYIVRRLTPLECERLQGYPDGWTDIGEYIDSNGKKRQASDAARYKALGNSIALPPWKWVLKRICACYERDATMASLFDGIGGFPYLWEQLNGKGTCLWASEIEEFPIAVTKVRIGE